MRLIKAFLAGITGLFIFVTLLSLLIPAHPKVSRTIMINTDSKEKVMAQVKSLSNWKNWQPLFASDSSKVVLGKLDGDEGVSCTVTYGEKVTHLKIIKADSSSVTFTLNAEGESEVVNQIFFSSLQQQIRVDWVATTNLHWYPWEKFYAIFIDKLTGPGYEASLNGLKQFVESH